MFFCLLLRRFDYSRKQASTTFAPTFAPTTFAARERRLGTRQSVFSFVTVVPLDLANLTSYHVACVCKLSDFDYFIYQRSKIFLDPVT